MAVSHKYRTFDQLLEDVSIDFSSYALEGMIDPAQLIKVAKGELRSWLKDQQNQASCPRCGTQHCKTTT